MKAIRYQHVKSGSIYIVLHDATMQAEGPLDNERVIVYQCQDDIRVWVRPYSEFMDGRFRVLPD
jgi:hypothetical protein